MKVIFIFLFGALVGIAATTVLNHRVEDPRNKLLVMSKNGMVDSAIDALGALQSGAVEPAELMLASAINFQIQSDLRRANVPEEEVRLARSWQARMRSHNSRLMLKQPVDGN